MMLKMVHDAGEIADLEQKAVCSSTNGRFQTFRSPVHSIAVFQLFAS